MKTFILLKYLFKVNCKLSWKKKNVKYQFYSYHIKENNSSGKNDKIFIGKNLRIFQNFDLSLVK